MIVVEEGGGVCNQEGIKSKAKTERKESAS